MAEDVDLTLTNSHIAALAAAVSSRDMESIAARYLDMDPETLDSIKDENMGKAEAFNREVIKRWRNSSSKPNEVKVLASILYKAAREGSYINHRKVHEILGVKESEVTELYSSGTAQPDETAERSEELLQLVEDLKEETEEAMRIEMAPWVKNYTVKMEDLYTELALEQMENKPTGPIPVKLESYTELFTKKEATQKPQKSDLEKKLPTKIRKKRKGKKILAKGDPGMGKSTFGRKIAFDWAKGVFTAVSVVFFVLMKLIRPGQTIENIIVEQTPPVDGLGKEKVKNILHTFGNSCLIIFDGFDEHEYGVNEDIVSIIQGRSLKFCNILLTTRPHCTEEIETYFPTQIRIEGFTKDQANQFISKTVSQSAKVKAVVSLSRESFLSDQSFHCCPMILLFLCILVDSDQLELDRKDVPIGEVYARLIRCIYRKYCVQNKLPFENLKFEEMLKRVGKLAWLMLPYNQIFGKKSCFVNRFGEDAFSIGLLIGYKDFRLSGHDTCDILCTFVHNTIQDFLGAFYFILSLNAGISIETLLGTGKKQDIFLKNRLFFQFCLWLLSDSCWDQYFKFTERQRIYESLVSHATVQLDIVQLDVVEMAWVFPVLLLVTDGNHDRQNADAIKFLQRALTECRGIRDLYLSSLSNYPPDLISDMCKRLLPNVKTFGDRMVYKVKPIKEEVREKSLTIHESASNRTEIFKLLRWCDEAQRHPDLNLLVQDLPTDLSTFMDSSLGNLSLFSVYVGTCRLQEDLELPKCPFLTGLYLINLEVDGNVLHAIATAVQRGKLPVLSNLSFAGAGTSITGKLSQLLNHKWPTLTHLDLDGCYLHVSDILTLQDRIISTRQKTLPNLISLVLNVGNVRDSMFGASISAIKFPSILTMILPSICPKDLHRKVQRPTYLPLINMFPIAFVNIKTLALKEVCKEEYQSVASCINQGKLPNLTKFGISMWKYVDVHQYVQTQTRMKIKNSVPIVDFQPKNVIEKLPPVEFPTLNDLSVHRFVLSTSHLLTVAMSTEFSGLSQLDISHSSGISGKLHYLVGYSFPSLTDLILSDCELNSYDLTSLAKATTKGRLPKLKHLDVSLNPETVGHLQNFFGQRQKWNSLLVLNIMQELSLDIDLSTLSDVRQCGALYHLQNLTLSVHPGDFLRFFKNVKWPNILHLVVHCAQVNGCSDLSKICQQIGDAIELKVFPSLKTLRLKSTKATRIDDSMRVDELSHILHGKSDQDGLIALLELFASVLKYSWLPILTRYMVGQNRESRQQLKAHVQSFFSRVRPFCYGVMSILDSEMSPPSANSQTSEKCSPVPSTVQQYPEMCSNLAKFRLILDLYWDCLQSFPIMPQTYILRNRKLMDAVFTTVKSLTEGKALDLQNIHSVIGDGLDVIPNASYRSFLKCLLDACCRHIESAVNEGQCDLQNFWDLFPESFRPSVQFLTSALNHCFNMFKVYNTGEPLDLKPVCNLLHNMLDNIPGLPKAAALYLKKFLEVCCDVVQDILNDKFDLQARLNMLLEYLDTEPNLTEPYRSYFRDWVYFLSSVPHEDPQSRAFLALFKYRLRKVGILVYSE